MSVAADAPTRQAKAHSPRAALAPELGRVRCALQGAGAAAVNAPSPPLERLGALFGLSEFERTVLVLCAGIELDAEIADLCAERGGPRFGLALEALPGAHWSALVPAAPLRRWRLIEVGSEGPLTARPIRIEERILHLLLGLDCPEAELVGVVAEPEAAGELTPTHDRVAERLSKLLLSERHAGRWPAVQICGTQPGIRRDVATLACSRAGLRLLALGAGALPGGRREGAELARLCAREAALSGAALLLDLDEVETADPDRRLAALRFATEIEAALILVGDEGLPGLERAFRLDLDPAPAAERRALWRTVLSDASGEDGDRGERSLNGTVDAVAAQFRLEPDAIWAAGHEALVEADGSLGERIWHACRKRARPALDDLAQRIDASAGWEDLVLPAAQLATLREIGVQVRHRTRVYDDWGFAARSQRGLGISVLLAGPSGTGKTMAAEVLANDLRLDLYRIDLSSVVSKYIGETEKNLRRVFAAAERGGAVLLFDEADALFGKRTEVKDSHDRFANIEISYLLQRMESYDGLAILTTNQRRALDDAFLRRLRFVVELPFPEAAQRREIWRRILPGDVPKDGLRYGRLGQLAIAGGNIRNVALGAAFLAAGEGAPVGMAHVLRAARSEYAKLERELTGPELEGWE